MIEQNSKTVRAIAWSEVFPWLSLVRVFRIAISARVLALAAAGVLITAIGWAVIGSVFGTDSLATFWIKPFTACPWTAVTCVVPNQPKLPLTIDLQTNEDLRAAWSGESRWNPRDPISGTWSLLSAPAIEGLAPGLRFPDITCLALCGLVSVAVWAFFGAAICRIAAVQLAAEEQVGLGAALRYACRKWPAYFAAPLFPVGGALLAAIPVLVLGWLMNVSLLFGGLLWPLALVAGLLMAVLLLGVLFGWPLMWATISTEGTDSFDALSRSYAYTFQRPLNYLFYAFVAGVIGWLGWIFVQNFAAGVIWMGYWAAGWGCGSDNINLIMNGTELEGLGGVGAVLIRFWAGCVKLLAVGFLFSYFWSAAAGIYLLLRRDVDATEMDEVYLDADKSEETFGLPTVTTDQAGAPVVEDEPNGEE